MNDRQENKNSMFLATEKVCDLNLAVWSGVPATVVAVGKFKQHVNRLRDLLEKQELIITGVRKDKLAALGLMAERTMPIAGMLYAYATATDNNTLRDSSKLSVSGLMKVRDTIAGERARVIHTLAVPLETDLMDYGLLAGGLTLLDNAITGYEQLLASPRVAIAVRKGATTEMQLEMTAASKVLRDSMDKLMAQYEVTSPEFFRLYTDARIIVDSGGSGGKGKIGVSVVDGMTQMPVEGATVSTDPATKELLTDMNGKVLLEGVAQGTVKVKASKGTQVSNEEEVTVKAGKTVSVLLKLM